MIKWLLISFLIVGTAQAQPYYFAASGSDANACTIGSPCKTLTRASGLTGDKFFNGGDTFTGTLTAHANEHWQSYGTGQAIFSGLKPLTGWVNNGNGTWSVTDASLPSTTLNVVIVNGAKQAIGRYPKTGYLTFTAHTDAALTTSQPNSPSFVGGTLAIRKAHYILDTYPLTGQAAGVLTYTGGGGLAVGSWNGNGYFIQNHVNCLTTTGDWCYDPATHKLTMWFGSANPSSYIIQAATIAQPVNTGVANLFINNLKFTGYNNYAFNGTNNANLTITNNTLQFNGISAINLYNANNANIGHNIIDYSGNTALTVNVAKNCVIEYNVVTNTGTIAGMGQNGDQGFGTGYYTGMSIADATNSTNNVYQYNTVSNSGYNGIQFAGENLTVQFNGIDNFCSILDDGGGIYTHGKNSLYQYASRSILNNVITYGIGAPAGTNNNTPSDVGIYTDDYSTHVLISGNTIAYVHQYGIFQHNNQNNTVTGNMSVFNGSSNLALIHDGIAPTAPLLNIAVVGNYFIGPVNEILLNIASGSTSLTSWGTGTTNYFGSVTNNPVVFKTQLFSHSVIPGDLTYWRTATLQDGTSTYNNITQPYKFYFNATNTSTVVVLAYNYIGVNGTSYSAGNLTLLPHTSVFLLQTTTPPPIPGGFKRRGRFQKVL